MLRRFLWETSYLAGEVSSFTKSHLASWLPSPGAWQHGNSSQSIISNSPPPRESCRICLF